MVLTLFMNKSFGKQLKMKYFQRVLFLLLTIVDVSTNAQEVTCEGEQLSNVYILIGHPGTVSPYKPGHILVFRCTDVNLKMYGQRTIECLSSGKWDNPYPKCGEVTCDLKSTTFGVKKIKPDGKTIFRAGESVEITCAETYQVLFTKENFKSFTCGEKGQWDYEPVCVEIRCEVPRDQHVYWPERYFWGDLKSEVKKSYSCISGYDQMSAEATCTRDGWTPNPLCVEVMCVANLPVNMRSDVTEDGHPGHEVSVRPGHTITLSCVGEGLELLGQRKITCLSNGEWNVPFPKCVRGKCGPPPQVDSADTTEMAKPQYNSGERVEYLCFSKYTLDLSPPYSKYLTCEQGEWKGNIKCLKPCSVPVEEMDKRGIEIKWGGRQKIFIPHQDRITFVCQSGKSLIGSSNLLIQYCTDGEMYLPECV